MSTSNTMVVSRYEEDLDWIHEALSVAPIDRVEVYNKGRSEVSLRDPRVSVRRVPNVGREGGTYLDYIIENYKSLPKRVWFLQGNPFEHSPDLLGLLSQHELYSDKPFQCLSFRYRDWLPPLDLIEDNNAFFLGDHRCSKYFLKEMQVVGHCKFHDEGIVSVVDQLEERYGSRNPFENMARKLGIATPGPITEFAYGACFHVLGSCVSRHPRWVYERARSFLFEHDSQGGPQGYVLERFWNYLLTGVSYQTLSDCYRSLVEESPMAVYCKERRQVWMKAPGRFLVSENPNTVVIFSQAGRLRKLVGLDIVGADESSAFAMSLDAAMSVFSSFMESKMAVSNSEYSRAAVYCSQRKRVWIKSPGAKVVVDNPHSTAILASDSGIRTVSGVELRGENMFVYHAESLEDAKTIFLIKTSGSKAVGSAGS